MAMEKSDMQLNLFLPVYFKIGSKVRKKANIDTMKYHT